MGVCIKDTTTQASRVVSLELLFTTFCCLSFLPFFPNFPGFFIGLHVSFFIMLYAFSSLLLATASLVRSSPVIIMDATLQPRQAVGNINLDQVLTTCQGREDDVKKAFSDMHLLTDAVKKIDTDNQAFKDYFGTGWDKTNRLKDWANEIKNNVAKAQRFVDGAPDLPVIQVTCEVLPGACKFERTMATTFVETGRIVLCPFLFDTRPGKGANLNHIADRVNGDATGSGSQLRSWQHVVLHELLHVRAGGYRTISAVGGSEDSRSCSTLTCAIR
jgi:hypothetical protein